MKGRLLDYSAKVMSELSRALSYPKVRQRVPSVDGSAFVEFLEANATKSPDPDKTPRRSRDPGDDYLLALAESCSAIVVSGDRDLLALSGELPIYAPRQFLASLDVG